MEQLIVSFRDSKRVPVVPPFSDFPRSISRVPAPSPGLASATVTSSKFALGTTKQAPLVPDSSPSSGAGTAFVKDFLPSDLSTGVGERTAPTQSSGSLPRAGPFYVSGNLLLGIAVSPASVVSFTFSPGTMSDLVFRVSSCSMSPFTE